MNISNSLNAILDSKEFEAMFGNVDPEGIMMSDTAIKEQRKSYQAGLNEVIDRQQVCANFAIYQDKVGMATRAIAIYPYKKSIASEKTIKIDDIFVFNGLVGCVVGLNDSESRRSGQDTRAHIVYANGTESHLLLSSLAAKTYKDQNYIVKFEDCRS